MNAFITLLEQHEKLAGWAQFIGVVATLLLTYFTAFAPGWRRKRQLRDAANRLLANGYEVIESYHRMLGHFAPFPLSIRAASLSMTSVVDELGRFPLFELDDQGPNSLARRLVAMGLTVTMVRLVLDASLEDLDGRTASEEEHQTLRTLVSERLAAAHDLVTGAELKRPEWPA